MTVTTTRPFKIDGTALNTYAYNIEVIDGIYGHPGRRGINAPTPYQDGSYSFGRKFYEERRFMLQMMVFATNVNGAITHTDGGFGHLYENLDTLMGLFHSDGLLTFSRTMADGTSTREIDVEVLSAFPVNSGAGASSYRFVVEFTAPRPFWREMPKITVNENAISSFPHAFNVATAGNVPIGDAKITIACTSAGSTPSLEIVSTGDIITVNDALSGGDSVVIDLATKSFTKNAVRTDASIERNRAWFLRMPPAASLGMSFDALSGTYNLTMEYYKKWI
jgi:hypothetical protein